MSEIEQAITERLSDLSPEIFEFRDDSHLHAGHIGNTGGGHYALMVVSTQFAGLSRIMRQRMVQQRLADWFTSGRIHALSISTYTPEEYFN